NIALSAQFLGLNREEIKARFQGMIEFAELGTFIDFPMKTYSSGMYVRLGFAIAAGVNPDVLIIDEVLSVGDAYFQKKSINRVESFRRSRKTIVIVSHAMLIIRSLCDKTLWLNEGKIEAFGKTKDVVNKYELFLKRREKVMFDGKDDGVQPIGMAAAKEDNGEYSKMIENGWEMEKIQIIKVELAGEDGKLKWRFTPGEKVRIRLYYDASTPINNPVFLLMVYGSDGTVLFATTNYNIDPFDFGKLKGEGCVEYTINQLNLNKGTYSLSVGVFLGQDQILLNNPADIHYKKYDFEVWSDKIDHGVIHMKGEWSVSENGS
ncbi:MAG: ABC transporter ATP-binding protein, partial [Thermoplasmata archaeon]